jgi:hypothetical protein
MKTKHWVGTLLAILLLIPWTVLAAPVGKITNLTGLVDITITGQAARNVVLGEAVNVGDFIRTKSKSKVEITFNEGNILRLSENTRLGITQYMSGEKQNSSIFNLFRGKIQNIVKVVGQAGSRYEVHTPTSVCGVRGTTFFNYYLNGVSAAIFQQGTGYGYNANMPQQIVTITAGQGMFVPDAASGPQVRSVTPQQMQQLINDTGMSQQPDSNSGTSGGTGGGLQQQQEVIVAPLPPPPTPPVYTPPPVVVPPPVSPPHQSGHPAYGGPQ